LQTEESFTVIHLARKKGFQQQQQQQQQQQHTGEKSSQIC
jgi:hypothetical protein